jgi:broad specificity phosphatase PhoE
MLPVDQEQTFPPLPPHQVMRKFIFISHPNVVVSKTVPVPQWPLSEVGRARMQTSLAQPWVREISAVYCSTEQKAIDGAAILARHLSLGYTTVHALGENDRSATGFLPPDEFEKVADQFLRGPTHRCAAGKRRLRRSSAFAVQWNR